MAIVVKSKRVKAKGRRRMNQNLVRSSFGLSPLPLTLVNTLCYTDEVSVTVTLGFGKFVFSCNGLFDPNITGTGHQPLYFDQLTAVYDHYTVLSSKVEGTFALPASSVLGCLVSLYIDDDTSTVGDAILASERINSKYSYVVPAVAKFDILRLDWNAAKVFGPNPTANDNLQGTSSTNPSEQQFYVFQVYDPSLSTFTARLFVKIMFTIFWDELVTVTAS